LARLFGCGFELSLTPRYTIAPSQPVPVVRLAEDQPDTRQVALLQWGLVAAWATDPKIGPQCINARSETAASKPAFRAAFRKRRCFIPVTDFYEWRSRSRAEGDSRSAGATAEGGVSDLSTLGIWVCAHRSR
jgi:putative SOS response-associated peptidase YedK